MSGSTSVDARGPIAAIAACACVAVVGCALWQVAEDQKKDAAVVRLRGTVSAVEPGHDALVVVLTRRPARDQPEDAIVDYFTRETDGVFYFAIVEPGVYSVAAFQDSDGDLTYDPGEPGLNSSDATTFELSSGDTREGIELVIRPDDRIPTEDGEGYDIRAWIDEIAATGTATTSRHLAALADVVDLAEPRFGSENGRRGLWEAWDFVYDGLQGVYFLEPYDPNRTPVLFVHGISGCTRGLPTSSGSRTTAGSTASNVPQRRGSGSATTCRATSATSDSRSSCTRTIPTWHGCSRWTEPRSGPARAPAEGRPCTARATPERAGNAAMPACPGSTPG
jgi:hypothetical protein